MRGSALYTPSTPEWVPFSSALASISAARSAAAVSVVKNGLPVPAAKMTTRPFSRWRIGPAADVRLGDPRHLDRALHPGVLAGALERVLQRQRVHDRAEHADVVALGGVHARHRAGAAAPEVAAADDDGDVDAQVADGDDLDGRCASSVAASRPEPDGPAKASPDGLKTIRFHRGAPIGSADLDLGEADDAGADPMQLA